MTATPSVVTNPVGPLISQIPEADDQFPSLAAAAHWRPRGCGIACARMILAARGQPDEPAWPLIAEAVEAGAYCGRGWIHQGLIDLLARRGIAGQADRNATPGALAHDLRSGALLVASVTVCFRGGQQRADGTGTHAPGGHLVVVSGVALDDDDHTIDAFRVHHPSATAENNWADRWIELAPFQASFSGAYLAFPP